MSKSKVCNVCKLDKPLAEFYRDSHSCAPDGRRSECKLCCNERQRRRRGKQKQRTEQGATLWLRERANNAELKREAEDAFEDAVSRPSAYELRNMGSGHGLAIDLGDVRHGVFWSRGWRGCEFDCGHRLDDWTTPMYTSVVRLPDGRTVWRRGCRKKFNSTEE